MKEIWEYTKDYGIGVEGFSAPWGIILILSMLVSFSYLLYMENIIIVGAVLILLLIPTTGVILYKTQSTGYQNNEMVNEFLEEMKKDKGTQDAELLKREDTNKYVVKVDEDVYNIDILDRVLTYEEGLKKVYSDRD